MGKWNSPNFKISHFASNNFSTFPLSYWEANSYYPRGLIMGKGNSPNFKIGWDRGVWVPGAFKLDHLQSIEPILFWNFSNFFHFILGSQLLLPQRANFGSWENFPFPNMDETEGIECLGHSNWTICSPLSHFCPEIFSTFSLSYWGANSYYPRGLILGVGRITHLPIWMTERGFSVWGIQTGPFAAL